MGNWGVTGSYVVEKHDESLGGLGADAFDLGDALSAGSSEFFDRAEVLQQGLAVGGADAGEVVEDGFAQFLAA